MSPSFPNRYFSNNQVPLLIVGIVSESSRQKLDTLLSHLALLHSVEQLTVSWLSRVSKPEEWDLSTWQFARHDDLPEKCTVDSFLELRNKLYNGELGFDNDFYLIEADNNLFTIFVERPDFDIAIITLDPTIRDSTLDFASDLFLGEDWDTDIKRFMANRVYINEAIRRQLLEILVHVFK